MNFAIRCLGLRIRSHGLFIRSFKLHKSNSREQIAIRENGLSNSRGRIAIRENGLSNSRGRIAIRENGLSNLRERITNPGERILIRENGLHNSIYRFTYALLLLKISMSLQGFRKRSFEKVFRHHD